MDGYSLSAKNEITALSFSTDCCKRAFLSALIHTGGSLVFGHGGMRVIIPAATAALEKKIDETLREVADGVRAVKDGSETVIEGQGVLPLMFGLGIFAKRGEETVVNEGIYPGIVRENCCAVWYIRGAFLGSGSASLTKGYHLEFALSGEALALDLIELLARFGIEGRLVGRKDKHVVYIKEGEAVSDCLALMGASGAVVELNSRLIMRSFRRDTNRRTNCEIANISKTVNAAVRQCEDIKLIESKQGLASLPEKLEIVARARTEYPDESFATLAERLGLSKSTLKNRLNKLGEIAENIREREKESNRD